MVLQKISFYLANHLQGLIVQCGIFIREGVQFLSDLAAAIYNMKKKVCIEILTYDLKTHLGGGEGGNFLKFFF